jgi:hypothetical protein
MTIDVAMDVASRGSCLCNTYFHYDFQPIRRDLIGVPRISV